MGCVGYLVAKAYAYGWLAYQAGVGKDSQAVIETNNKNLLHQLYIATIGCTFMAERLLGE